MIDDQTITKFHASYTPVTESGCWIWDKPIKPGYGSLVVNGQAMPAHRLSWMIHQGPIPDGLFICHKCDIRPCVNPDHLFTGTHQDNMKDAWEKGNYGKPKKSFWGKAPEKERISPYGHYQVMSVAKIRRNPPQEVSKVEENRLRRMAKRQGLKLLKNGRRDPRALDYGGYMVCDALTNAPAIGSSSDGGWPYSATLDEVEDYLTGGDEE